MWTVSAEAPKEKPSSTEASEGVGGEYRSRTDDLLHAMQAL